ncbi:hypothetical protein ABEF95_002271 [Exophiala dermatitidis]
MAGNNEKQKVPLGGPQEVTIQSLTKEPTDFAAAKETDASNQPRRAVVTRNGFRVHPQPTSDPLDPLNWTILQKHCIVVVVMLKYFLLTYLTTTTVASFTELQKQYNISYAQTNWTIAIPALGIALGPLIFSPIADTIGRRIVFIVGTTILLVSTIGAAKAQTYSTYMAARAFQGLGAAPASTVGLAIINDMFYDHERGQKIGLWVLAIDTGLLVGPVVGGFMNIVSAEWVQWLMAIFIGVLLILELCFMPETLYPRNYMLSKSPAAPVLSGAGDATDLELELEAFKSARHQTDDADADTLDLPRTKKLPFINLRPIPGIRHPQLWHSTLRFLLTFKMLTVFIAVFIYCFLWYWWMLSILTMLPAAYPNYKPQIQGLLFVGLLLGTLFAEVVLGGQLSDYIYIKLAKRNNHIRIPEMRLWLIYPGAILTATGLIVWGISIDKGYHWIVGQVAFFLFAAGIQIGNTVVCTYIVDCYPLQSMSMVTFYAVCINMSAFIEPFFISPWQVASGWTWCFAAQGLIVLFGALPIFALLHRYGGKIRLISGVPAWVNPEFDAAL